MMRFVCVLFLGTISLTLAQKPAPKNVPQVLLALPMGLPAGKTTKLELRGLHLHTVTAVSGSVGKVKLLGKDKVGVPNGLDASRVGDSRVTLEFTAPPETKGDIKGEIKSEVEFKLTSPEGKATARIPLEPASIVAEKEPNDSFKQAQPIQIGDTVAGVIDRNQDVDVFRFEGKKGQRVLIDVIAARRGSGLDAFLSVYDGEGQLLQSVDDVAGSRDASLTLTLPRDGGYYVVVSDADDTGGPTHGYRLVLSAK
jgi:hypothetical protein